MEPTLVLQVLWLVGTDMWIQQESVQEPVVLENMEMPFITPEQLLIVEVVLHAILIVMNV